MDALVGNPEHGTSRFCFAKENEVYLVYLPDGGKGFLDLTHARGSYSVQWFNPRTGGELVSGNVTEVKGGGKVSLGAPPADWEEDWLVVVRVR